jgi:hypothetical protein
VTEKGAIDGDIDDALSTTPMPRYNAMLAILRNTLYMLAHRFPIVIAGLRALTDMEAYLNVVHVNIPWTIFILSNLTRWTASYA